VAKPGAEADSAAVLSAAGLYDMQVRTQALVRPVHRVQLLRDGRLRVEPSVVSQKQTLWRDVDEPMCEGWEPGFGFGDGEGRYADDASMDAGSDATKPEKQKANPAKGLFAFYTTMDMPLGRATLTQTTVKLNRDDTGFVRGTHLYYDLDGDGIPDLAAWEGQGHGPGHLDGPTTTDDKWYRLFLVNVNGAWKVLGSDVYGYGCGC
jgi:hypothetical protein